MTKSRVSDDWCGLRIYSRRCFGMLDNGFYPPCTGFSSSNSLTSHCVGCSPESLQVPSTGASRAEEVLAPTAFEARLNAQGAAVKHVTMMPKREAELRTASDQK